MKFRLLSVVTLTGLSLSLLGACSDQFANCDEDKTCLGASAASGGNHEGGDGDTGSGGAETGDGDTSAGGNGDAGGGADGSGGTIIDPCDACEGETPVCKEEDEERTCVECTGDNLSACEQPGEFCSPENKCVSCLDNSHCTTPEASVCDLSSETDPNSCTGCADNEGCAHLEEAGTLLCNTESASCVACLTADDCGGKVCDPDTHSCTNLPAGELFQCEPCQYDAQCMPGRLCVEHLFPFNPEATDPQTVGTYCTWTKEAVVGEKSGGCYENGAPFVGDATAPSVNNPTPTDFCVLRSTTCEGYRDHSKPNCTSTDADASCGAEGINDAQCELKSATYLCTYPCLGSEDCKNPATCTAGGYCSL